MANKKKLMIGPMASWLKVWPKRLVVPLTPTRTARHVDSYIAAFARALKNKDIHNIAIVGRNGAGKSSFLMTYFSGWRKFWFRLYRGRIIMLSLGTFSELQDEDQKKGRVKELELHILQQLLYSVRKRELPCSRYSRLAAVGVPGFVVRLLFVFCLLFYGLWSYALTVRFPLFSWIANDCLNHISSVVGLDESSLPVFAQILVVGYFLALLFAVVFRLYIAVRRLRFALNIHSPSVELNVERNSGDSCILNKYLDEVVYFFEEVRCAAVVIEDLDRFKSTEVFEKLRELNKVLNNATQIRGSHKPIRFIYALSDDLFIGEKRVKFFDYILPILPVVNSMNSSVQFEEILKGGLRSGGFTEELKRAVDAIAHHISDYRTISDICNEFFVYYAVLPGTPKPERILGMMVFKAFFPNDFVLLHDDKGIFKQVLDLRKQLVDSRRNDYEQELKKINGDLKALVDRRKSAVKDLHIMYLESGLSKFVPVSVRGIVVGGKTIAWGDMRKNPDLIESLVGQSFAVHYSDPLGRRQVLTGTWNAIVKLLPVAYRDYEGARAATEVLFEQDEKRLASQVKEVTSRRDIVESMPLSSLFAEVTAAQKLLQDKLTEEVKNPAKIALLYEMLCADMLPERYKHYISMPQAGGLSESDAEFAHSVLLGLALPYNRKLVSPQKVLSEIPLQRLRRREALNFCLLDFVIAKKKTEALVCVAQAICRNERENHQYLEEYFHAAKVSPQDIFKFILQYWPSYFDDVAKGKHFTQKYVNMALFGGMMAVGLDKSLLSDAVREKMEKIPDLQALVDGKVLSGGDLVNLAKTLRLKFNRCDFYRLDKQTRNGLIRVRSYALNKYMVESIAKRFSGYSKRFDRENLTFLDDSRFDKRILEYVLDSFAEYLENVYSKLRNPQKEEDTLVMRVANDEAIAIEDRKRFLDKQADLSGSVITNIKNEALRKMMGGT